MPVAGTIARGMNKLYARAGKICKVMDPEIGEAILSVTKKESADDVTVGEAWEELAKTNPRVRAFLLKALQGGAWGQLVMCHVPILMAIIMKDAIRKHIPFMKLITALMEEDSEGEPSEVTKATGLKKEDVDEAMKVAMSMLPQMMANMGHGSATGTERAPTVEAEAS
jgi:hypothetical protein